MTATVMEESIYNLLPQIVEKTQRREKPSFISGFRPYVKRAVAQSKSPWKTIGPPKVQVPCPKNFLQKHSKEQKIPAKKKRNKKVELGVPKRTDHPIMGVQCTRNFINTNASNAIVAVPKKPLPVYVDRSKGDRFLLETSGLVPKYLKKKDYGVIPKYVIKRTEDTRKAQEQYDHYVRETLRQNAMKRLTEEERESLLEGLKTNWEEVHQAFQNLSVELDTIPKKRYKEKLEEDIKQLEHDIHIIEKHKVIYIANK
ncbi:enkurin isoform X2 [Erythrolamprus reginae]